MSFNFYNRSNIKQSDNFIRLNETPNVSPKELAKKVKQLKGRTYMSIYMKILLNYFQSMSIIQSLELKWPTIIKDNLNNVSTAGNFSQGISFQCNLYNFDIQLQEIYFKTVFLSILPFFLVLIMSIFLFAKQIYKRKSQFIRFFVILIVSSIFWQPNIIKISFDSLKCKEVDLDFFLKANLNINCNDYGFFLWYGSF